MYPTRFLPACADRLGVVLLMLFGGGHRTRRSTDTTTPVTPPRKRPQHPNPYGLARKPIVTPVSRNPAPRDAPPLHRSCLNPDVGATRHLTPLLSDAPVLWRLARLGTISATVIPAVALRQLYGRSCQGYFSKPMARACMATRVGRPHRAWDRLPGGGLGHAGHAGGLRSIRNGAGGGRGSDDQHAGLCAMSATTHYAGATRRVVCRTQGLKDGR